MIPLTIDSRNYDVVLGFDVDSKSYAFTGSHNQKRSFSKKMAADPQLMVYYIKKHFKNSRVACAYEAGGTGYELYDTLIANDIDCFVLAPNSIPKPANCTVKNNRIDSRRIFHAMKSESDDLSCIRVPSKTYRELRHLIRIYDTYASLQKASKQRIKALLLFEALHKALPIDTRKWTAPFMKELRALACSPSTRARLNALLEDLNYARHQLSETLRMIKTFVYKQPVLKQYITYLISIPGIGIRIATYILGKVGDPELLRSPRELGAFLGLVPKERSTGDTVHKGAISRSGNKTARYLLIEAAWVAIRYDKELEQFYYRIRARNPKHSGSQKAITAVARKLSARIYAVLKNKRPYIMH